VPRIDSDCQGRRNGTEFSGGRLGREDGVFIACLLRQREYVTVEGEKRNGAPEVVAERVEFPLEKYRAPFRS